ncbi:MAG: outer membrane beta-barrel protein [Burkholderiales bacterium]|nr:outer membrane beta-barrel protein [Opitutaceae bacterium]
MITKRRLALLSTLATTPVFAAPFLAIGDNAELFLTARAEARYEDNVTLSSDDEVEDEIFEFAPGVEVVFGKNSLTRGTISFYERFVAYSESTDLNEELANFLFKSTYEGAKLKLDTNLSFNEYYQNTRDTAGTSTLVRFDEYAAGVGGELTVTEKSKIGAGLKYGATDYKTGGFDDRETYTVPANYYFAIRPKLDLSTGIQYRQTDLDIGADSEDYYFNVGARGEFTPKLIGTFTVGYTLRDTDAAGVDDESLVGLDAGLSYLYSEKTQFTLNMSNDFGTSSQGGGQEVASINLGVRSQIAADWSARASVGYQEIDYINTTRTDEYMTGLLGLTYVVNQAISLDAYYSYADNDSDFSDFTANTLSVSANFRY